LKQESKGERDDDRSERGWMGDGGGPHGAPDLHLLFIMAVSFKLMDISGTAGQIATAGFLYRRC
jgi:hypothetical protein